MIDKDYSLTLDLKDKFKNKLPSSPIEFVSGDLNSSILNITLTDNGSVVDLTGCTIQANFKKPDNTAVSIDTTGDYVTITDATNGLIKCELTTQILAAVGYVFSNITIINTDLSRVTSTSFKFRVKENYDTAESIGSTNDYPMLIELLVKTQNVDANETTRQTNESTRQSQETTRQVNESERVTTESARVTAEDTRNSNESTRQSQESTRVTAENSRASVEAARVTAESGRVSAESDRVSAETSRANAESSRVIIEAARGTAESNRDSAESTRTLNESTRQTQETTRQSNEADRVQKLQMITEDNILKGSYPTPTNLITETDGSGRVLKRVYTQNNLKTEEIERGDFDNNSPLLLIRKLYDSSQKGTSKLAHHLTYSIINEVTSDTVEESAYDSVDIVVSRAGLAINPLNSYNVTSLSTVANNILVTDGAISTRKLVNGVSALEIQNNKILTTFTTIDTNQTITI